MGEDDGGVGGGRGGYPTPAASAGQPPYTPQGKGQQPPRERFGQIATKEDVVGVVGGVHVGHGRHHGRQRLNMLPRQAVHHPPGRQHAQGKGEAQAQVEVARQQGDKFGRIIAQRGVEIKKRIAIALRHVGCPAAEKHPLPYQHIQLGQAQKVEADVIGAGQVRLENRP